MEKINITGLVFTEDDMDKITKVMNEYLEVHPDEEYIFHDGRELLNFIGAREFGEICSGGFYSVLDGSEIYMDEYALDEIPFIYVLPLKNQMSLFNKAYESFVEVTNEFKERLKDFYKFIPSDFNIRKRIAQVVGYAFDLEEINK